MEAPKWTDIVSAISTAIGVIVSIPVGAATIVGVVITCKQYNANKKEKRLELTSATIDIEGLIDLLAKIIAMLQKAEDYIPNSQLIKALKIKSVQKRNVLVSKLTKIQQRIEYSQRAATWLSDNKIEQLAKHASQSALKAALDNYPELRAITEEDWQERVNCFQADIVYYLVLIRRCLTSGRANVLDNPKTDYYQSLPVQFYVDALSDIIKLIPPHDLSVDAFRELTCYIEQLINRIRVKFSSNLYTTQTS